MEKYLYDELFEQETKHWWFLARRQIIIQLLQYFCPDKAYNLLDIGCGCGANLLALSRYYNCTGIEPSDEGIDYCAKRNLKITKGYLPDKIDLPDNSFDIITMIDVLEHIKQHNLVLKTVHRLLKKNGVFLATVPAYQWLYTKRDEFHHHCRRYSKSELNTLLSSGGLEKIILSYYNFFLFPLALLERGTKKFLKKDKPKPDLFIPPKPLNNFLKSVFAFEKKLLPKISLPYGLSVIALYKK